jgi:hypothetical protein
MTNTYLKGDITGLWGSVNGSQKGILDARPNASGTYIGTSGTNSVTVVANFINGAEEVVCQGSIG